MARRASGVPCATFAGLIRRVGVLTIVDSVANLANENTTSLVVPFKWSLVDQKRKVFNYLRHGDAPLVGAREFSFGAVCVVASLLVRIVSAVVLVIAFPRLEDAAPVAATVLDRAASVERAVAFVLVGIITAVVVSVTRPQARNALAVGAVEFVALASQISADAHPVVVYQLG